MYAFPPPSNQRERQWAYWDNGYSVAELDKIVSMGEELNPKVAVTFGAKEGPALTSQRNSDISWVTPDPSSMWLYERVTHHTLEVNRDYFGFDLWGFSEDLQYTRYDASKGDQHYNYHVDNGGRGASSRKLSMSLLLSEASDYEGGDLVLNFDGNEVVMQPIRGRAYFFPSYVIHRVTPVTRGVRRSLVAWATGVIR